MKFLGCLLLILITPNCTSESDSSKTNPAGHDHHHHHHHGDHSPSTQPVAFEITGVVVDTSEQPVGEAMVLQGGRPETTVLTQEDGTFTMMFEPPSQGMSSIVAAKAGYRASGNDNVTQDQPIKIKIQRIEGPDNEEYIYQDPGDGIDDMKEDCTHCHKSFVSQFLSSKHASATKGPLLQDLYAGVSRAYTNQADCLSAGGQWREGKEPGTNGSALMKCYLGGGVLPDLNETCGGPEQLSCDSLHLSTQAQPTNFGSCADCHAPGINGKAGGRNLHDATGLAFEKGVHCDTCHKVRDVDLSLPPGVGNRLVMGRPSEQGRTFFDWDPVFYGPLPDVPTPIMGGSYQPKFNQSLFCAGCHEQNQQALLPNQQLDETRWPDGLPIHTTYSEWKDGPYNTEKTPCQHCHMPSTYGRINAVEGATLDNQSSTHGFVRDPDDIRQHTFLGPLMGDPRLIDDALYVSVKTNLESDQLHATISITNIGCGHAVPTGEPMRALILVVEVAGEGCAESQASGGMTIPDTGGALAQGVVGSSVHIDNEILTWPQAAVTAQMGDVVRVVRPTGEYDDYLGVGPFSNPQWSAEQKGIEIYSPVGEARIISRQGNELTLESPLPAQPGDLVYLGQPFGESITDGADSLYIAGMAGSSFSKVLLDQENNRHVPHYKAIDVASDNRIGPGISARTEHSFTLPAECTGGSVRAKLLYRPTPLRMAKLRGWEAKDYIIAEGMADF